MRPLCPPPALSGSDMPPHATPRDFWPAEACPRTGATWPYECAWSVPASTTREGSRIRAGDVRSHVAWVCVTQTSRARQIAERRVFMCVSDTELLSWAEPGRAKTGVECRLTQSTVMRSQSTSLRAQLPWSLSWSRSWSRSDGFHVPLSQHIGRFQLHPENQILRRALRPAAPA